MYSRRSRTPLLLLLLLACAHSQPYLGWPWSVDAWIAKGMQDWSSTTAHMILLGLGVGIVVADYWFSAAPRRLPDAPRLRILWAAPIVFAVAAVVLWTLRVHHWAGDFVGDRIIAEPSYYTPVVETAEPLGTVTMAYTCRLARWFGATCATGIQMESVLYGASSVLAMALWARRFPQPGKVFAMVALSGYAVLFCGYVEKGTIKALALNAWYVYAGTRVLTGGAAGWCYAASLFLALATLMHGSSLVWLPAHAVAVWTLPGWRARLLSVACWLLPVIAMVLSVLTGLTPLRGNPMGTTLAFLSWTTDLCLTYWRGNTLCGQPFFSIEHGFWFINSLLAMAPVATLCVPEALWRGGRSRLTLWLALGASGWLFLSAIWHPGLSFSWFSDWDIFALPPYVVSVCAVVVASTQLEAMDFRHFSAVWIALTAPHAWLWWRIWQGVG